MSETKHTPGPWRAEESAHQQEFSHWIGTTSLKVMPRQSTIAAVLNAGSEESAANARLIAAAPELLAGCRALLAIYDEHLGGSGLQGVRDARAAIAKAEGR
jgi:hypothetical protein